MLCIAAVSKPLVQMFNEERKIFLSIYVNFVTWSRPAAHINILTTDYVEAMLKWYLIFILWWVVLLPQIVQLNLNREADNQRFEKVRHLASECVVKIGYRPPSVHHYLMVTDCSEAALLRQISCADSIRNQESGCASCSSTQHQLSSSFATKRCVEMSSIQFSWIHGIWLMLSVRRDMTVRCTVSNNANRVLAYIQSRLPADNKSVEKNPAPATIRSQCRKQFCYNCFGSNWQLNLHI